MTSAATPALRTRGKTRRDPAIDYLRAFVILMVLAAHCGLAYSTAVREPTAWNSLIPIVDLRSASPVFNYLFDLADICLMGAMFFVSALFVEPALVRHGLGGFLRDRVLRLGVPFAAAVTLILPLGYYAAWGLGRPGGSYRKFFLELARGHFNAVGPAWFLWVLLAFDCFLALCSLLFRARLQRWARSVEQLGERPGRMAAVLIAVCAAIYLPFFAHAGFAYYGGWRYITPPLLLEPSRLPVYWIWGCLGFLAGVSGLGRGLLAPSGRLAKHWRLWAAAGAVEFNLQCIRLQMSALTAARTPGPHLLLGLVWVVTHVVCVFGLLAFFRGAVRERHPVLDSLARCSYAIYLLHYVFVLWSQRWLLTAPLGAFGKFTASLAFTLACSWGTAVLVTKTPGLRRIL